MSARVSEGTTHPAETDPPAVISAAVNRSVVAHRIVQLGTLLTLMWKWSYFRPAHYIYVDIPLHDNFFPAWLQSVTTLRIAFLGSVAALTVNLFIGSRLLQKVCCLVSLIGTAVLCLHQASYNDMTFVTAWWACLWSLWFVHRLDDEDQDEALRRAAFLSRLIISVILLGGAAGKWTSEYWSGEVFYDIYFRDRNFWVFNILRENFDDATLRELSKWYSRKVVLIETIAGICLWRLPAKWAAAFGVTILTSIALLSNFMLFSVLCSLIGLAAVGFFVRGPSQ